MFNENTNNISNINKISNSKNNTDQVNANWIKHTKVTNNVELSTQYAHVCLQHKLEKKWILFINPEESSIELLAKTHDIDATKVLMVNFKHPVDTNTNVNLERVKSVLCQGNCSAVIVSNSHFNKEEVTQLQVAASVGKTQCILLRKRVLH